MAADYRRRYDDEESGEFSIRRKDAGSHTTLFVWLAVGGVSLVVVATAVVAVAVLAYNESTAAKLPGSWKGRFDLGPGPTDHVYTFNKDGTFREEAFDLQGQRLRASDSRWRVVGGEVEIDWDNGSFEVAVVNWIDDNTLHYEIVEHIQQGQIGLTTVFNRQK